MSVIVFASSKGGAGKSTSAVLLATELAATGASVTVIDADENMPVSDWAAHAGKPQNLSVISDVSERTIIDTVERAAAASAFVIVDLEGTASMMAGFAMSRADLVIIPVQGSQLDAKEAVKSIALVKAQEQAFRREIPFAVLFTRTNASVRPRTLKEIQAQVYDAGFPVFNVEIFERDAFRAVFSFGGTLYTLDPKNVSNIPGAIMNARAFAVEVVQRLRGLPIDEELTGNLEVA